MVKSKVGRPPKKAEPGTTTTVTVRLTAKVKNLIVEMAEGYGLSIAEYITALVERDVR